MKLYFLLIAASLLFAHRALGQQYNLFETNLTCDKSKKDLILRGHDRIKRIMGEMMKEGKLVTFTFGQQLQKENIQLTYTIAAESEIKFKEAVAEWKKRADVGNSEFFKAFWKACSKRKDSISNNAKVTYPVIKDLWAPVAVVEGIDELPDPELDYKIVFDFTVFPMVGDNKSKMDSAATNWGLSDIGRIYNLHIAAGIPKDKIHFVVAVHGFAVRSFLSSDAYSKKFKMDNPNRPIIEELERVGVKFLVCGQSLSWMGDKKEMLLPQAKVSLTAQTTLSSYQLKGYALKSLGND